MKIGVIGAGTGLAHARIARELADRGHEAVFVGEISDFTTERLGTLNEILKNQNEAFMNQIYEIKALPRDHEFLNPPFQSNNRQARRKAEKEAKKRKKQRKS